MSLSRKYQGVKERQHYRDRKDVWLEPGFGPGTLAPAVGSPQYRPLWVLWKRPLSEQGKQSTEDLSAC